ncbi:hypothetical protein CYMTET_17071 [Cymbomonas tetramitiformis]|uniref:Uncharacterized protein n=1 Tax=Cymbomonas tetramitiformis TaxID=36881 RepID=A0AAE0GBC6_9CHLO|nr:hypothetical protein CYMTET_17071 [Cymbomonas tetramitiformis]
MRYVLLVNTAVEWCGSAACLLAPELIFVGIQGVGLESVRWYGITLSVFGLMSFLASRNLALTKADSIWSGMTAYHPLIALCQVYRIFNYPQERLQGAGALIVHTALAIAFIRLYLDISDCPEDS